MGDVRKRSGRKGGGGEGGRKELEKGRREGEEEFLAETRGEMIFSAFDNQNLTPRQVFKGDDVTHPHLRRSGFGFRLHDSLPSALCFQTPPVAAGIPGWGRRTDGLTSPLPETPPTRDPSPS